MNPHELLSINAPTRCRCGWSTTQPTIDMALETYQSHRDDVDEAIRLDSLQADITVARAMNSSAA